MLKRLALLLVFFLSIGVIDSFACGCGSLPQPKPANNAELVKRILDQAEYIFIGKMTGFEYRKGIINRDMEEERMRTPLLTYESEFAKLSVERWFKGPIGKEAVLLTQATRNSDGTNSGTSCDYHFKEDETYI